MLRKVTDTQGEVWEVVRGSESYGMMVVLFCRISDGRVMKSYLHADSAMAADAEVDASSDAELLERLDDAEPGP